MNRYVIHINGSPRVERMKHEMDSLYFGEYKIFDAIVRESANEGISESFKEIIRQNYNEPHIHILEDDVRFLCKKSRAIFENTFNLIPEDWQIFLGGSYTYKEVNNFVDYLEIEDYRSFHNVIIRKSAYDSFLSHDYKDVKNIDTWVSRIIKKAYLCNPQVAIQHDGYSYNRGKEVNYNSFLKDKNLLNEVTS